MPAETECFIVTDTMETNIIDDSHASTSTMEEGVIQSVDEEKDKNEAQLIPGIGNMQDTGATIDMISPDITADVGNEFAYGDCEKLTQMNNL